jgi:hypothetical protein
VVQLVEDWAMPEYRFATGHPFETVLITGERGAIRATSEAVECSIAGKNTIHTWSLPRPGQALPGASLETNWFFGSFGAALAAFLRDVEAERGKDEDLQHLRSVTGLALAVGEATRSNRWVELGAGGHWK